MKLLIVSATREEISLSIPTLEKFNIPYLITGVGMTATAYSLGMNLDYYKPDLTINVGIAGAIDKSLNIGDVVQIEKDTFYELGAEDGDQFLPIESLGFGTSNYSDLNSNILDTNLNKVHAITVNKVHGDEKSILAISNIAPDAQIESMEGAAFFYACQQQNIACIQIRAISNYVERRNRDNWNIPLAIKNLNNWLQKTINSIS